MLVHVSKQIQENDLFKINSVVVYIIMQISLQFLKKIYCFSVQLYPFLLVPLRESEGRIPEIEPNGVPKQSRPQEALCRLGHGKAGGETEVQD